MYRKHAKKYWYSFILGPFFMVPEACGEFILPYEVNYAYYIDSAHLGVKFLNPVRASSVVMSVFSAMGGVAGNLREVVIVGISSDNDTIIIETEGRIIDGSLRKSLHEVKEVIGR